MKVRMKLVAYFALTMLASGIAVLAQETPSQTQQTPSQTTTGASGAAIAAATGRSLPDYVLGPGDEISILAVDIGEIANKAIRISTSGDISLPMIGRIHAAGLTVQQLQDEITERLKVYIRQPDISVSVSQFRSQPVSVIGAVRSPGVVQLEGRKTLIEVLSLVGGTLPEASTIVTITRSSEWGPIPLPNATNDPAASVSVATVSLRAIIEATHPEQNIHILPNDLITIPRAPVVFAAGTVNKPGGFALNEENETISVMQLIALAGGVGPTANTKDARIVRPVPGSTRLEVPINLKDVMAGKAKDVMLEPGDILVVPDSYAKGALRRTLDTAVQMTVGMIIYR